MALSNMPLWATVSTVENQQSSTEFNRWVGRNVQRFRKGAYLSQVELAQEMAERGFSFGQTTVVKVEQGTRPLKLEEAQAIAELLGVPLPVLISHVWNPELPKLSEAAEQLHSALEGIQIRLRRKERLDQEIAQQRRWQRDAERRLAEYGARQDEDGNWSAPWIFVHGAATYVPQSDYRKVDEDEAEAFLKREGQVHG
jgi:transcriptional regulator with XRE-family HTH domain